MLELSYLSQPLHADSCNSWVRLKNAYQSLPESSTYRHNCPGCTKSLSKLTWCVVRMLQTIGFQYSIFPFTTGIWEVKPDFFLT